MADYRINDVNLYISKTREAALNTQETDGADFLKIVTTQPTYLLPGVEFVTDAGRPGNGHEFATYVCPTYLTVPRLPITDDVNTSYAGRLLLRALGGSITTAQLGSTAAYEHYCKQIDTQSSRQLPATTVISKIGTDASFLFAGMIVNSYSISQDRANRPQFSAELVGTGKFVTPHGVSSLPTAVSTLACLDGNNTLLSWTDTVGAQTLSSSGCTLLNWNVSINNNIRTEDRCPGDSTVTITDPDSSLVVTPAYRSRMVLGEARQCTATITVLQDETIDNWYTYATGDILTDVLFSARGAVIESTHRHTLSITMEKARIVSIEPTTVDGDAAYTMNLESMWDSSASTSVSGRVINTETSAFV